MSHARLKHHDPDKFKHSYSRRAPQKGVRAHALQPSRVTLKGARALALLANPAIVKLYDMSIVTKPVSKRL